MSARDWLRYLVVFAGGAVVFLGVFAYAPGLDHNPEWGARRAALAVGTRSNLVFPVLFLAGFTLWMDGHLWE